MQTLQWEDSKIPTACVQLDTHALKVNQHTRHPLCALRATLLLPDSQVACCAMMGISLTPAQLHALLAQMATSVTVTTLLLRCAFSQPNAKVVHQ